MLFLLQLLNEDEVNAVLRTCEYQKAMAFLRGRTKADFSECLIVAAVSVIPSGREGTFLFR